MIDTSKCPHRSLGGMCDHKDWRNRPCAIDEGRDDLCPLTYQGDLTRSKKEEDCGER
jgi:hypothetical protein